MFLSFRLIRSRALLLICLQLVSTHALAAASGAASSPVLIVSAAQQLLMLDEQAGTILKGFNFPFPLHKKIWRSSDGQFAYLSSPMGWVLQLDIAQRMVRRQVQIATQTTGIALSVDDRYLMVANSLPTSLIALNSTDFSVIRTLDVKDKNGKASAVAAIHSATARKSFVAIMRDIPELWEMSYDEHAEPIYEGFVHDYKMGEGIALRGPFPPRRTLLDQPLGHFLFDADSTHAIGAGANGLLQVINLNIRRKIRQFYLQSDVVPDAGLILEQENNSILLLPSATEKILYPIAMQNWRELPAIATQIAGFTLEQQAQPAQAAQASFTQEVWLYRQEKDATKRSTESPQHCRQLLDVKVLGLLPQREGNFFDQCGSSTWSADRKSILFSGYVERHAALLIYDAESKRLIRTIAIPDRIEP